MVRVPTVFNATEFGVTRSFLAAPGIISAAGAIRLICSAFPDAWTSRRRHPGV